MELLTGTGWVDSGTEAVMGAGTSSPHLSALQESRELGHHSIALWKAAGGVDHRKRSLNPPQSHSTL